ncbi:MAG: DUF177 domain-containing protein [Actinomycetota bacterium]|nr:DUF177 domain-containing protein [Actinomycetota bacterium]
MAARTDSFDLGRLELSSGSGRSIDLNVGLDDFEFGGQDYSAPEPLTPVRLDAVRTVSGYSLRLRFEAELDGPCMRCLETAAATVEVDAREVDQPGGGEDLRSPYLAGQELDLHGWARDALALALPVQIVCGEDCLGLCPVCGENLNTAGPDHGHEPEPDSRWSKLSELRFE